MKSKEWKKKEQEYKKEIESWKEQFEQAKMIIDNIKRITGCKSNDGVEIIESVECKFKPSKEFIKLMKEGYKKSSKENLEVAKEMEKVTSKTIDDLIFCFECGEYEKEEFMASWCKNKNYRGLIVEDIKQFLAKKIEEFEKNFDSWDIEYGNLIVSLKSWNKFKKQLLGDD